MKAHKSHSRGTKSSSKTFQKFKGHCFHFNDYGFGTGCSMSIYGCVSAVPILLAIGCKSPSTCDSKALEKKLKK